MSVQNMSNTLVATLPTSNTTSTWESILKTEKISDKLRTAVMAFNLDECRTMNVIGLSFKLISAGASEEECLNIIKKITPSGNFYILQLRFPQIFKFQYLADEAIETLQRDYISGYFDGQFLNLTEFIYVFEFTHTLAASKATLDNLKVYLQRSETDTILPRVQEDSVRIDVAIVCVPESDLKEGMKQMLQQGLQQGIQQGIQQSIVILQDDAQFQPAAKRIRSELQIPTFTAPELGITKPDLRMTTPFENSKTANIMGQLCDFVRDHQLVMFQMQSKITPFEQRKFSKYAHSMPDFTIHDAFTVIASKDCTKVVHISCEDDELTEQVQGITISGETKTSANSSKDPIGQLLAGMDKTLGDMFNKALKERKLLSQLKMYGLHFITDCDTCEVITADVKIGKRTKIYKGNAQITISDALNRVCHQLVKATS